MDFLEDLLDFGDRKRRKRGGFFQNNNHDGDLDDDDHDDDHHHHENDDDHHHQYQTNPGTQVHQNLKAFLPGSICRNCSTQTVQDAKFCHNCGVVIQKVLNCASCSSKLPENALFCPQCGYKNG